MGKTKQDIFEQTSGVLDELEKLEKFDSSHMQLLASLALNNDSEIRARVAELLVIAEPQKAENILLQLLDDQNQLVRVNACDSLCICKSQQVLSALFKKAKTDLYLVRGYAVLSISEVAKNGEFDLTLVYNKLKSFFEIETSLWVRISYFYSFYILGDHEYFIDLLNAINSYSYKNRCFALNLLLDIIDKNNAKSIKQVLEERLPIERSHAVISNIKILLKLAEKF